MNKKMLALVLAAVVPAMVFCAEAPAPEKATPEATVSAAPEVKAEVKTEAKTPRFVGFRNFGRSTAASCRTGVHALKNNLDNVLLAAALINGAELIAENFIQKGENRGVVVKVIKAMIKKLTLKADAETNATLMAHKRLVAQIAVEAALIVGLAVHYGYEGSKLAWNHMPSFKKTVEPTK